MLSGSNSTLFLTEVDQHHPKPLCGNKLRYYILRHNLFFDRLLIGDSQINNNLEIRDLLWANNLTQDCDQDVLHDLDVLLEEGYLLPVIRNDYPSLQTLRSEHASRKIDNTPPEAYVDFIESKIGKQRVSYNIQDVSRLFKQRVIEAFTTGSNVGRGGISKEKCKRIVGYVVEQEPLLYKSLREWAEIQVSKGILTSRDYRIFDRAVAGAYRHNIPLSLGINIDRPISESRQLYPDKLYFGKPVINQEKLSRQPTREEFLQSFPILSEKLLSKIPAKTILYLKGSKKYNIDPSPHYLAVNSQLSHYRDTGEINRDQFLSALELFAAEISVIAQELSGSLKSQYLLKKKADQSQAQVNFWNEMKVQGIGFIPVIGPSAGIIWAYRGALNDYRAAAKQEDFLRGFIAGMAAQKNHDNTDEVSIIR